MYGYRLGELHGMPLRELVSAESRGGLDAILPAIQTQGQWRGEITFIRKDGRVFPGRVSTALLKGDQGKPYGMVAIGNDISDEKRVQSELNARAQALERGALELKARNAELARANAELEQFAYVASHDLQEPLRMVASYTGLLKRRYQGKLGEDADEFIEFAVDGALRMQRLINDLLAYSRVGTRGRPFEPTDMNTVCEQALQNLEVLIQENNAKVTCAALPVIEGDGTQLVLVLQNLIGNAIKFRSENAPEVHIEVEPRPGSWVFSVQDNGIGFNPQYADKIFLMFQRLDSSRPGTGMGLAICKRVIDRHGGRIWAESETGKGSIFHFSIPRPTE
jgi:PAS domain S-box-containing protein